MKIVFCGPPHSGKSVFLANLIEKMPTDGHTTVRACPDGEGKWSNNNNQKETTLVRKKRKFTKSFIDNACQIIDNQVSDIVLVDVGGVMSKENEQVFKHCDSFVVLSSDEQKKKQWLEFGEKLGLNCIACLDSSLQGQEEIYTRNPYLQGQIVGLERGASLQNSKVLNALVSDIIEKSNYVQKDESSNTKETIIDDTKLGFELGYGEEITTEKGQSIKKVKWKDEAIPKVYKAVKEKLSSNQQVKVYGIRANFILSAICKACKLQEINDISTYDICLKQYIPIKKIPQKRRTNQADGLKYHLIENSENVFIDIDILNQQYTLEQYKNCVLPRIKKEKNLYISGRIPNWLLASITNSYDSKKIFTFQPGKGFTCVASNNEKDLGIIVDGVDGININQYYKDKKEARDNKLPDLSREEGVLSKIKRAFNSIKLKRKNSKYIDETIKAKIIIPDTTENNSQDTFRKNMQTDNNEKTPEYNKSNKDNIKREEEENTKEDLGG